MFLPARSMAHAAERAALLPTEGESFTKPSTTTGAAEVVRAMEDIGELRAFFGDEADEMMAELDSIERDGSISLEEWRARLLEQVSQIGGGGES